MSGTTDHSTLILRAILSFIIFSMACAFQTEPPLPEEVVKKTFKITGQDVQRIQRNLGGW
jgi:hypothetical protein